MGVTAWIALGLVVGLIAGQVVGGRQPLGLIITAALGIAGALLGGRVATRPFRVTVIQGFFNISPGITALVDAIALTGVYHLAAGRHRLHR